MLKKIITIFLLPFVFGCLFSPVCRAMGHVSDRVSTSWPSVNADHTITFMVAHDIPPSGRIVITPEDGQFFIVGGFDYTDVDLATSSSSFGPYVDRSLASSSSTFSDGVAVVASSTSGSITITLNSTRGIAAGNYVRIELGANATFGEAGDKQILNPVSTGAYKINLTAYDAAGGYIERGHTYVITINPVAMSAGMGKIRANGTPFGVLQYGTSQALMSLTTNYQAFCRYSDTASTSYADMVNDFDYAMSSSTNGVYFHSILLTGLVNGNSYTYYIRCRDKNNVDDITDYVISFEISAQEGQEGEESGTPGRGGGGGGGGTGGGHGIGEGPGTWEFLPYPPPPGMPGVVFRGWAYPLSTVYILKDGTEAGKVNTNNQAEFGAFLSELPQGVYTFGLWSSDSDSRRSITYSTTFYIEEGTQTTVSDIFLPPTIEVGKNSIQSGESLEVFGQSVPGSTVEAWFYLVKKGDLKDNEIIKKEGTVADSGKWTLYIDTSGVNNGNYKVKARSNITDVGYSEFSQILDVAVGGAPAIKACPGADLNHDGRVNLTDFSILLYYWGTDNACADQNQDSAVNLTDFSIMMYYWTG